MNLTSLETSELIASSGATHPRVSLDDINRAIAHEHYFTVGAAIRALGHPVPADPSQIDTYTICVLVLANGWIITGISAAVSPENYNMEKGNLFARENAVRQIWPLMGFALKDRLYAETIPDKTPPQAKPAPGDDYEF